MGQIKRAGTCRWATQTLFLPAASIWLSASDYPWACTRQPFIHLLETTEFCEGCLHWCPRGPDSPGWPMSAAAEPVERAGMDAD
jgi:hypothetical protein